MTRVNDEAFVFSLNKTVCEPLERWTLVHAVIKVRGKPVTHAWIERGDGFGNGVVYDIFAGWWNLDEYYMLVACDVEYKATYSASEARALRVATEHCGPWDERIATAHKKD